MIFIGIDNGADGAVVALDGQCRVVFQEVAPVINVSKTGKKRIPNVSRICDILRQLNDPFGAGGVTFAVLEKAQAFPKEGAVVSFNYGRGFGAWEAALAAFQIPHAVIDPKEWQKHILAGVEGGDTKARALIKVQRAIPTLKTIEPRCRVPHLGLPDAACMALYAIQIGASKVEANPFG